MADPERDWLLDTSILVDLFRGHSAARAWIDSLPEERLFISVITAGELLAGCANRAEQRKVEQELDLYTILWLDEAISEYALELYKTFHLSHGVGFLDCLIAATAIQNGLTLATLNLKHFAPLSVITVQRPY
jgi:predicted nucleic acid-binding protein